MDVEITNSKNWVIIKLFGTKMKKVLKQELSCLEMKGDESLGIFLNRMQSQLRQSDVLGSKVEDDDCGAILLKSVISHYPILATVLRTNENLDFMNAIGMLLREERQSKNSPSTSVIASTTKEQDIKGRSKNVRACYYYGKLG